MYITRRTTNMRFALYTRTANGTYHIGTYASYTEAENHAWGDWWVKVID